MKFLVFGLLSVRLNTRPKQGKYEATIIEKSDKIKCNTVNDFLKFFLICLKFLSLGL